MNQLYNKNKSIIENRNVSKDKILNTLNEKVIKQTLECILKQRKADASTMQKRPSVKPRERYGERDIDTFPIRDMKRNTLLRDERLQPEFVTRRATDDRMNDGIRDNKRDKRSTGGRSESRSGSRK